MVHPGDFVFGDTEGVVVILKDMMMDVLVAAEELRRGVSVAGAFAKYDPL